MMEKISLSFGVKNGVLEESRRRGISYKHKKEEG
jgi:hypothetical protein